LTTLALLPCCAAAMQITVANNTATDCYEITSAVLVTNPPRCGLNIEAAAPVPWSPTRIANLWNAMSSMEPYALRHVHNFGPECTNIGNRIYDVRNSPPQTGKPFWHGGLGHWDTLPVGLLDGGAAVVYRARDGYLEPLHRATVARYAPQPAGREFVELAPPLHVPIQPNDILVIDQHYTHWPSQDSITNKAMRERLISLNRYGLFAPERASGVDYDMDATQHCPEGGSTASLKVAFPGGANKGVFQWFSKAGQFQQTLPTGAVFNVQIWLRQEGLTTGVVQIRCGNQHTQALVVGPDWKKYTFAFAVDRAKMPTQGPDKLGVYTADAGTLWIDNFAVWDAAEPRGAVRRIHRAALQQARPGTLRIWTPLHRNSLADALVGDLFTARQERNRSFDGLNTHQQLMLCSATRADPWLNLHPLTSDEELRQLMEYLGAPADTGWGRQRAARGQVAPWTAVFSNIYLECGNETWNSIFAPLAWPGKPQVYTAVANRMFKLIKTSPYYRRGQVLCVASGWGHMPTGWTKEVAELTREADVVDVAAYFGGSDGFSVEGSGGDDTTKAQEIIKGQLILCGPGLVGQLRRELVTMRSTLAAQTGRHVLLADYESGPGYILPNPGSVFRPRDEMVGKSLGMGIVTLDCFLMESALGFVAQNYFKYNVGPNWVTHNNEDDMYPHASWLALQMRNRHCAGDVLQVVPRARKTVNLPAQELEGRTYDGKPRRLQYKGCSAIPLTECYAFRSGPRHTIVALNRSWNEPRTVTLTLPFVPQSTAELYYLSGDPFAGNHTTYAIKEQHMTLNAVTSPFTFVLPPSSAYFMVIMEDCKP
jgi:hypothetical protein